MSTTRFVILHHRLSDGEHWDLMIERGDVLVTWQLATDPTKSPLGEPIPATHIQDHRKAYLEYEGPVSRNRGEVRRVEAGVCEVIEASDNCWRLRLDGGHIRGAYALCHRESSDWTFGVSC